MSDRHIDITTVALHDIVYYNHSCRILLQACPLYVAEIAPKERRGTMVAMVISFSITAVVVSFNYKWPLEFTTTFL